MFKLLILSLATSTLLTPYSFEVENTKIYTVTAYTSRIEETDDTPFITASGKKVREGIVAANFLPFGTKIKFRGIDRVFVVEDRMNRRYGMDRFDIFMSSLEEAQEWGVKKLELEILSK